MPSVEIVAIGTELLLGQLVDTNTAHVAQTLAASGINVYASHAVGDNRARIAATIGGALERADGVIATGGLGPTVDDLTKEAVCDVFGVETELNEPALRTMEEIFVRSGREMRENNLKQAQIPKGATVLPNAYGTAPGFVIERAGGKFVACMPGVPIEMKPMLAERLLPWLRSRFHLEQAIFTRVLHTINIAESEIDHRIDDLFRTLENPKIAVLAHDFRCDVKIMARADSESSARDVIAPVEAVIARRLSGHVFGYDEETLPFAIHGLLRRSEQTVAAAESCTGGLVSAALTGVSGASKSFVGGIVAYDNFVKEQLLDVQRHTIVRFGAVSEETVRAMAEGVRSRLQASIGVATTGIAGPTGGTEEKPVGLVWIAIVTPDAVHARKLQLRGDRASIQARATTATLGLLWRALGRGEPF